MARFIGTAGDFQKEKAISRRVNAMMGFLIGFTAIVFVLGYVAGRRSLWWALVAFGLTYPAFRLLERLFDRQIRMARADDDGASGEMRPPHEAGGNDVLHCENLPTFPCIFPFSSGTHAVTELKIRHCGSSSAVSTTVEALNI
jgi:hypothetical protein